MILDFITCHTDKERDAETGYDYFGARYYWSLLKHWTSVDPLVDDYLHISPYAYCNWNPIKYVDPDGREWIVGGLAFEMQNKKNKSLSQSTQKEMLTANRHWERGRAIRGKSIGALGWYKVI